MNGKWMIELWRAGGLLLTALIPGWFFDRPFLFLLLGAIAYLAWHVFNLARLERWLKYGEKSDPPASSGVWADVFNEIYRMEMRSHKQQRKLARTLNRFEEAAAALPDGIVVLSTHGIIEWFNTAASDMLGLRSPQDIGQRIANLLRHPDFIELLAAAGAGRAIELPSPSNSEIMLTAQIVPYGKEQHLLVTRDITRVRRLEQVRRDFVANVSHELRTPLTVLNGFLETLNESQEECPKSWVRSLQLMRQQAERMQRLVNDLLMLSRLELDNKAPDQTVVAVPDMLAAIVQDARALSGERRHRIALDAEPSLLLQGNHDELRSAFSNLVYNAVQYTPAKGDIRVRWFSDAQGAHLEVSDTGEGIAPQHIPRLTERFYRVDSARSRASGGTGLGLAIVKHVLTRHGAQLRIQSELGKGSTFTCDFPAQAVAHPPDAVRA
jgi:two-component system phosphate regulon sensor histidine kinase PhoR